MTARDRTTYLPALDGLRAVAIGLVLWHHGPVILQAPWPMLQTWPGRLSATGWMGVDLFFVLSGFLITGILLRTRDTRETQGALAGLGRFWLRRALRIFPLAYLYLGLLYAAAKGLGFPPLLTRYEHFASWALYLGNLEVVRRGWTDGALAILWSLAIEEQFYLVWPFVVCAPGLGPRRLLALLLAICVLSPVVRYFTYAWLGYPAVYVATFCRLDALGLGAALAVAFADARLRGPLLRLCRALVVPALVVLAATLAYPFGMLYPGRYPPWFPVWGYSWIALAFAVLVGACLDPGPIARCLLGNRAVRYVGKISYGLYLWHYLVGEVVQRLDPRSPFPARLGLWLGATLLVATVSWFAFERPLLRLKDRL